MPDVYAAIAEVDVATRNAWPSSWSSGPPTPKQRAMLDLLILLMAAAVGGCGGSEEPDGAGGAPTTTAAPPSTAATPTTSEPVVLADGRHPVYLKTVDRDRRTITFDLIEFFTGEAAPRRPPKMARSPRRPTTTTSAT